MITNDSPPSFTVREGGSCELDPVKNITQLDIVTTRCVYVTIWSQRKWLKLGDHFGKVKY